MGTNDIVYPDNLNREEWLVMIEERKNPFFEYPENYDQKIWRYMDFTKFVSLIDSRCLFFPSSVKLGDSFEGSVSIENLKKRPEVIEATIERFKSGFPESNFGADMEIRMRQQLSAFDEMDSQLLQWQRNWTFINCWHINEHESLAMWKLYTSSNQAIAIQSTFGRLRICLQPHRMPPHGEPILSKVKYIDYEKDVVPRNIHLAEYFYKRKSFEHEAELRAVLQELPLVPASRDSDGRVTGWYYDYAKPKVDGKNLIIELDMLVEAVYVAPTAPNWFYSLVKKVLEKYGIDKKIIRSSLDKDPVF